MCIKISFLKEGWPDHFLIMIQMLIPAGVVGWFVRFFLFIIRRFLALLGMTDLMMDKIG